MGLEQTKEVSEEQLYNNKETEQTWYPWESSKKKSTSEQKETKRLVLPFGKNILWTDDTKVELCGRCALHYIWSNTAFHENYMIPTVTHGGESVRGCGSALELQNLDHLP